MKNTLITMSCIFIAQSSLSQEVATENSVIQLGPEYIIPFTADQLPGYEPKTEEKETDESGIINLGPEYIIPFTEDQLPGYEPKTEEKETDESGITKLGPEYIIPFTEDQLPGYEPKTEEKETDESGITELGPEYIIPFTEDQLPGYEPSSESSNPFDLESAISTTADKNTLRYLNKLQQTIDKSVTPDKAEKLSSRRTKRSKLK